MPQDIENMQNIGFRVWGSFLLWVISGSRATPEVKEKKSCFITQAKNCKPAFATKKKLIHSENLQDGPPQLQVGV